VVSEVILVPVKCLLSEWGRGNKAGAANKQALPCPLITKKEELKK